jgi:hypothetical protein
MDGPIQAKSMSCQPCASDSSLRCAALGETMLLGSYNLTRPRGIYWAGRNLGDLVSDRAALGLSDPRREGEEP